MAHWFFRLLGVLCAGLPLVAAGQPGANSDSLAAEANRLFDTGNQHYAAQSGEGHLIAVQLYIKGLDLALRSGDARTIGRGEFLMGAFYDSQTQPNEALEKYRRAFAIFSTLNEPCWQLNCLQGIAMAFLKQAKPDSSAHYRRQAFGLVDHCDDVELTVRLLTNISLDTDYPPFGEPSTIEARLNKAQRIIEQAEQAHRLDSLTREAVWVYLLRTQAGYYHNRDEYARALVLRERIEHLLLNSQSIYRHRNYEVMGILCEKLGLLHRALVYKDSAFADVKRHKVQDVLAARRIGAEYQAELARQRAQDAEFEAQAARQWVLGLVVAGGLALCMVAVLAWAYVARRRTNRRLKESEAEKGLLLQELHHRVKNNLQMISSMLMVQATRLQDPNAREAVQQSRRRVDAIATVHRSLNPGEVQATLNLADFLSELAQNLASDTSELVQLEFDVQPLYTHQDIAVPIGILVNEWITNSIKHAMHPDTGLTIHLSLHIDAPAAMAELAYTDSGPGIPHTPESMAPGHFGLRLIKLMTAQLEGTFHLEGSTWRVRFPLPKA